MTHHIVISLAVLAMGAITPVDIEYTERNFSRKHLPMKHKSVDLL